MFEQRAVTVFLLASLASLTRSAEEEDAAADDDEDNIVTENDPDRLLHVNNNCVSRQLVLTDGVFFSRLLPRDANQYSTLIRFVNDDADDVQESVGLRNK